MWEIRRLNLDTGCLKRTFNLECQNSSISVDLIIHHRSFPLLASLFTPRAYHICHGILRFYFVPHPPALPSSSSPPCPRHILPRSLTLPPDLLAPSFRLSSFPHLFLIYLSFGSPPSSSYFSVRRVGPSRHRRRENGWGAFRLFLLPSVYLHFKFHLN